MFFALCRFEIFIPEGHSLKAKRSVLNRLKERLRVRFHAAVAEVGTQDLWQRGTLAAALVGPRPGGLEDGLAAMRRLVEEEPRCRITSWEERVEPFGEGGTRFDQDAAGASGGSDRGDDPGAETDWEVPREGDEFFGPRPAPGRGE